MGNTEFPHYGTAVHAGVAFDRAGIGAARRPDPNGAGWAMMRPSAFLALATPLPKPRPSLEWLSAAIAAGEAICPAELTVREGARLPTVVRHEGRHRMTAILAMHGDIEVPVRISLQHAADADMTPEAFARLRRGMIAQRGGPAVDGPLFGEAEPDLGGRRRSGVPPDPAASCGSGAMSRSKARSGGLGFREVAFSAGGLKL